MTYDFKDIPCIDCITLPICISRQRKKISREFLSLDVLSKCDRINLYAIGTGYLVASEFLENGYKNYLTKKGK